MPFKPPTEKEMREMLAYVQAGGLPEVAAQAAGVDGKRFSFWMESASGVKCPRKVRGFVDKVRQAHGQARLRAEITAFNEKPLEWLKNNAWGKELPQEGASPLVELLPMILEILEPYPAARQALAKKFLTG